MKPLFRTLLDRTPAQTAENHTRKTSRQDSDTTVVSLPTRAEQWRAEANKQRIYGLAEFRRCDEEKALPSREWDYYHKETTQRLRDDPKGGSREMCNKSRLDSPHLYTRDQVRRWR